MIQKIFLVLLLFTITQLFAQKTVVFNGRTYLLYPQEIDNSNNSGRSSSYLYLDRDMRVGGISFPPIIGSMPDGEYLIYTNNHNLIKRGRRRKAGYDTVKVVYGTFTIKNNQKQGDAFIYRRYIQSKVDCRVHYENDLLQGNVTMNVVDDEVFDNINQSYSFRGDIYKGGKFAKIHFKDGLLNDKVSVYFIHHKDTFLSKVMETRNGLRHGKYEVYHYSGKRKKIYVYSTVRGEFENGEKHGHWEYKRKNYLEEFKIYHAGELTYRKHSWYYSDTGNYMRESFGKDSVLKYFPDYKKEKTKSAIYTFYGRQSDDSFEVITYTYRNETRHAFRAYGKISAYYGGDYDTMINGHLFRVEEEYYERYKKKSCRIKDYLMVDTVLKDYYAYGRTSVFRELFDRETGQYITTIRFNAYDKYFFKDSLVGQVRKEYKYRRYTETEFYQQALNYSYTNMIYKKGKARDFAVYYKVSGGANNGSIIKYIKIPSHYDTIYMIDTFMQNGKFLYKDDKYFEFGYYNLIHDNNGYYLDHEGKNFMANEIYSFLEADPVQHKTLMLGNTRFKGKLNLKVNYTRRPNKVKAGVYEYRENILDIFEKKLSIEIVVEKWKSALHVGRTAIFIIPSRYRSLNYENGLLNGDMEFTDIIGQTSLEAYCSDNRLLGTVHIRPHKFVQGRRYRYMKKIKRDNTYPMVGSVMQYEKGLNHGQWLMYYYGQISQTYNFQNNMQNGLQYTFNTGSEHNISYVYTMKNDTVNGTAYVMYSDGMPEKIGHYKMGLPHGDFTKYDASGDTGKYFKQRFQFHNGYLTGDYTEYRDTDNMKMKISFSLSDSIYCEELGKTRYLNVNNELKALRKVELKVEKNMNGYDFMDKIFKQKNFRKGYYRYYYASGYLFKQGFKEYNQPSGRWHVFREGNNRLYKTIDFKDSTLFAHTPDSLRTYGLVKAYYDNGQLMFTGLATDFRFKYSCESDADMPTENDQYLSFYDTLGRSVLINGNGFVSELQANGNKLKEGKIVNNKKEGVWIYYSKFGLAEEIGLYKNGLKTGRWLSGDLGGLNIDEKVCFMSDEEYRWWIRAFGGNLNLREEYYDNGKLVNSNSVNTIKR